MRALPQFITISLLLFVILAPSHTFASSEAAPLDIADPFETIDSGIDAESFGPHIDFSSSESAGAGAGGGGVGALPGGPPSVPRVAQLRGASDDAATQASSAVATGNNPHVARLYLLSRKNSRARCLDGSPAGYYLRRGFGSGANKWIMILEAGGWCFNAKSCANRAKGPLGSSKKWPPTSDVKYGGVGSTDSAVNPAFYNWNLVLVKYCDGSSFTGGYGKLPPNSETGRTLYFRGHWNLQGTLQDLLARQGLNAGKQMLVGGCSAGGVATSIKCDQISRWLANYNITTKCFMDGGYFPDVADKEGQYSMRQKVQQMAGVHDMGRIGINAECKRAMKKTNETWKCFFPEYNLQFSRSPMLIVNSLSDYKAISMTLAPRPKGTQDPLLRCLRSSYRSCTPGQLKLLQSFSAKCSQSGSRGQARRNFASLQISSVLEVPSSLEGSFPPVVFPTPDEGDSTTTRWKVLPDIWPTLSEQYADKIAVFDPHHGQKRGLTFSELESAIHDFGEGLRVYGLKQGECAALFAENSHRWLIADQGVMDIGARDAVRGAKSSGTELFHILENSDSTAVIVDNVEVLVHIAPFLEASSVKDIVKFAVVLWPPVSKGQETNTDWKTSSTCSKWFSLYSFEEVSAAGSASRLTHDALSRSAPRPASRPDDVATLVYTSGTTGNPKGVMLTHSNLMHQVNNFDCVLTPDAGDVTLSLLPPWHMYERSCEYFLLSRGVQLVYSNVKSFKEDLIKYPPDYFVAVPLVFEVLYSGVQKKLAAASGARAAIAKFLIKVSALHKEALRIWTGMAVLRSRENVQGLMFMKAVAECLGAGLLALVLLPLHLLAEKLLYTKVKAAIGIKKAAVSGGGSLPSHVDKFFEQVGITLLNGYGLTETSPVLTVRRSYNNALGSIGSPVPGTEIKIVDLETGVGLPAGQRGLVKARGPQVMKGYYKNQAATAMAIDKDGWFSTGDLGWISPLTPVGAARNAGGLLVLDGRAKDTIVLASGENVEPAFVEEVALSSPVIRQIMLVGQDQRKLGALIVVNEEEMEAAVASMRAEKGMEGNEVTEKEQRTVVRQELNRCFTEAGCLPHERVGPFAILDEPFTVDNGLLTATMKMRRDVIYDRYKELCDKLFQH
ncbi:unnamed protein product [Closterium sp. Yama58-4]|nr:unnamed protein product [Closterium sp. Yama58-4]